MFGQAPGHRGAAIRVTAGQYLGFTAILAVSVGGALLGATLLPPAALPYFGAAAHRVAAGGMAGLAGNTIAT